MKYCACGHEIRKIKGVWRHRRQHDKYSGVGGSGGVTFGEFCSNYKIVPIGQYKAEVCGCRKPEPTTLIPSERKE